MEQPDSEIPRMARHEAVRRDLCSGTVTFLFTDVEGSTKLLHKLGVADYAEATAEHREILRRVFSAHAGVEGRYAGRRLLRRFPAAHRQVRLT